MKKRKPIFFLFYGVAALFVLYILVSAFAGNLFSSVPDSVVAEFYTYCYTVQGKGIALRSEELLLADSETPSLSYLVAEGDRVAVNSRVARYYSEEISEKDFAALEALEEAERILNETVASVGSSDILKLRDTVLEKILNYLDNSEQERYALTVSAADDLQILFNKIDIFRSGASYYREALEQIQQKKSQLIQQIGLKESYVTSANAGYFSSDFDGYEALRYDPSRRMTVDDFQKYYEATPAEKPSRYIGKTQNSPTWYFAAVFDSADVSFLSEGATVSLEFDRDTSGTRRLFFTVVSVSADSSGKTAVVFQGSQLTAYEFSLRRTPVSLVVQTYRGLRVPSEALRVQDGETGVFVLVGQRVVFKPVQVLHSFDSGISYSIVTASKTSGTRMLMENDEVLTNGKDMFDGKVVSGNG